MAAYFHGHHHNGRRVAILNIVVSVVLLGALLGVRWTPIGPALQKTDLMRFGFAGPPRFVQLVQIQAERTPHEPLTDVGKVVTSGPRGGESVVGRSSPRGKPSPQSRSTGLEDVGEARHDLVARAMASRGTVPVFQSDELVIETLVRPEYPEEARSRGIEGRVAVLALVDTLGVVREAEVLDPSGERILDAASLDAVMRCKFRPYRVELQAKEVFAVFRFSFRIY